MTYPKKTYYKYRPLLSDRINRIPYDSTRRLIESRELYYAVPSSFNDPYDCNLRLHTADSTDHDWSRYMDSMVTQYPSRAKKIAQAKKSKIWKTSPEAFNFGEDIHRKLYEDSSALCLSKKADSIPMFSYYADSHHGIAVELTFADDEIPCGIPCGDTSNPDQLYQRKIVFNDVEYSLTFPELNYHRLHGSRQLVKSLIFTKLDDWKHEEEFRVFRRGVAASAVTFPPSMLTRIIFGVRSIPEDIELVKQWLTGHRSPVVLSKAEALPNKFGLSIVDFETFGH